MTRTVPVRYGRNYKVVLSIVLPGLLTVPFIGAMQLLKALPEWQLWAEAALVSFLWSRTRSLCDVGRVAMARPAVCVQRRGTRGSLVVVLLTSLAWLWPARAAARLDSAEALRPIA